MRQQEKTPPRCVDATVKKAKSSGIARISVLLAILVFCSSEKGAALDPTSHISQYGHTVWRVQDGYFGGAAPTTITQTSDGYIWVGTEAGLYRFDGVRFVRWNSPSAQELPSSLVLHLLGARDGSLWVGTIAGLAHLVKDRLTVYQKDEGWWIGGIIEDREGKIWFRGLQKHNRAYALCQVLEQELEFRCYGSKEGIESSGEAVLAQDTSGNFWIGGTPLVRWRPGTSKTYPTQALRVLRSAIGVVAILPDSDGSVWVGINVAGRGGGLQRVINGTLRPFLAPQLNGETINVETLAKDRHGSLWVGTTKGLYRIRGTDVDRYGTAEGLSDDVVRNILEDREGNIWVATSRGLEMFRDLRVRSISKREGLNNPGVQSVAAARDGSVWIGGDRLQLLGPHGVSFGPGKDLPGNSVATTFIDHAGRLWVGMNDKLFIYEQGRFREIRKEDGSAPGMAVGITEDSEHSIWVETRGQPGALLLIQDLKVRKKFPPPAVPMARKIVADPRGGIWLGLMTGDLAHYRDDQIHTFSFGDHPKSPVMAIMMASDGSVLGATGFGVVGWKDGKTQILDARNGLPCKEINGLISDDAGNLWLYTQCGLIKIGNDEMELWWEHPDRKLKLRVFDAFDGVQPGFSYFNNSTKTPDGRLWFTNESVVQMIDPAHMPENTVPPPVDISALVADHKAYTPGSAIRLPPLTRDLEIDYTALSYVAPQKVVFRYMLEGRDAGWQDAGTRRQAFYNDLRPAHYRFRVIACNNDGIWNDIGATLDFSIAPAWFQTMWFLSSCVVGGLALILSFFRLRMLQMQKSLTTRFNERLVERTRIARELHDTFLQTLQGSKLVADDALEKSSDPAHVRRAMVQLAAWLEQAIEEGRAALNSLRTSTTQTNDLAEAFKRATEESQMQGRIEASFSVTGHSKETHPVVRDEIYRIGYEAIRNACTHSNGNRLEISLRYGKDLAVCVSDNGVGIDPTVADQGKNGHFGLQGMRERAARIGGKLLIVSSPKSGTEVTIVVPGGIVFRKSRVTIPDKMMYLFRRNGPNLPR
jgi:signal transduction histidine kinase/ligand-binding sensor domain-containing protein